MNRPRVLVSDDHDHMRYMLGRLLASDYDVVAEAADGLQAVDEAGRVRPDVAVLDISMPVMNGFEATRLLRDRMPELHIIFVTDHADDAYVEEAFKAGVRGYVIKRFAKKDLIKAVREVLDGRLFRSTTFAQS